MLNETMLNETMFNATVVDWSLPTALFVPMGIAFVAWSIGVFVFIVCVCHKQFCDDDGEDVGLGMAIPAVCIMGASLVLLPLGIASIVIAVDGAWSGPPDVLITFGVISAACGSVVCLMCGCCLCPSLIECSEGLVKVTNSHN